MAHPKQLDPQLEPVGILVQPACLQHKYIRHPNASHIFERPERLRAVLLGIAAAGARLEEANGSADAAQSQKDKEDVKAREDDLSTLLSSLNLTKQPPGSPSIPPRHLHIVQPPTPTPAGQVLLHHPALQVAHSPPPDYAIPYLPSTAAGGSRKFGPSLPSSEYLKELLKWAQEAPERIRTTGCEIPPDRGLNQGDLYLGPGSVLAIEGAVQTVCQAVDRVVGFSVKEHANILLNDFKQEPSTPPATSNSASTYTPATTSGSTSSEPTAAPNSTNGAATAYGGESEQAGESSTAFRKAFCAIRPPGHHCGENEPSGFCYVNNVVVAAMHAYLEHDIDRAIIIDFDLHHGNGTQALVMPLNAATHADELAMKAGKPHSGLKGKDGKPRRGWKGFYGSVHDIYSYPCEDGDLDLVKDASLNLAAHGQFIENVHLQPYSSTSDFYTRIYPLYSTLLERAEHFLRSTSSPTPPSPLPTHPSHPIPSETPTSESNRTPDLPEGYDPSRTILFISAGFDACEHEYPAMQRHDRRVPASFFERYTADIARFADKWCEGKVVSVLEGGYSDGALISGAMGCVLGLASAGGRESGRETGGLDVKKEGDQGQEQGQGTGKGELRAGAPGVLGEEEWYGEEEIALLEKATKKKRTGKLHPLSPDLASNSRLARTHALLGQLEAVAPPAPPPSASNSSSPRRSGREGMMMPSHSAPTSLGQFGQSAQSTPITAGAGAGGRMTLRTRKADLSEGVEALVTPPRTAQASGAGRGRGRGRGGGVGMSGQDGTATTANTPQKADIASVGTDSTGGALKQTTGSEVVHNDDPSESKVPPTPTIKVLPANRDVATPPARSTRQLRSTPSPSPRKTGPDAARSSGIGPPRATAHAPPNAGSPMPAGLSDAESTSASVSAASADLDELMGAMGSMAIKGSPAKFAEHPLVYDLTGQGQGEVGGQKDLHGLQGTATIEETAAAGSQIDMSAAAALHEHVSTTLTPSAPVAPPPGKIFLKFTRPGTTPPPPPPPPPAP